MNKRELVAAVADRISGDKKTAGEVVDAIVDIIAATVTDGGKVTLPGFGTFEPALRAPRRARHIITGEPIEIPQTLIPRFKAATAFKIAVAERAA